MLADARAIRVLDAGPATAPARVMHEGADRACFSPDGRMLLTAGPDGTARLWDVATGRPVGAPMAHRARLSAVAFAPDGRTVATGAIDATVRLWDDSGRPRHPPIPVSHWVSELRFGPDGTRLLATCEGSNGHLIDPAAGAFVGPRVRFYGSGQGVARVFSPRFRPDGRVALVAYTYDRADDAIARLDARTGQPVGVPWTFAGTIQAAEYGPDGRSVLLLIGDRARLCDPETGRDLVAPFGEGLLSCTFLPDGRQVATGGKDKTIRIWDAATGKQVGGPLGPLGQPVRYLQAGGAGRTLLSATQEGGTRVWDLATRQPIGPTSSHDMAWSRPSLADDGRHLVLIDRGAQVRTLPAPEEGPVEALRARADALTGLHLEERGGVDLVAAPAGTTPPRPDRAPGSDDWDERVALQSSARGDLASAAWHLRRAVDRRPDDWYPHALLARALGRLGQPAEAEAEAVRARAAALPGTAADWDAHRGYDALGERRWADAVAAFGRALAVDRPDAPDLHEARGRARAKLADWAGASADFRLAPWRRFSMLSDQELVVTVALLGDDRDFYDELCRYLLEKARARDQSQRSARLVNGFVAWVVSLGPGGLADPAEVLRLAEAAVPGSTGDDEATARLTVGAALCRAGRPADAVAALDVARVIPGSTSSFEVDAFLALAHRLLGHDAKADRLRDALARERPTGDAIKDALRRHILAESDPPG